MRPFLLSCKIVVMPNVVKHLLAAKRIDPFAIADNCIKYDVNRRYAAIA